jgi:hypothetical protein
MNKINDYLDQGLAAYDQGDQATATQALRSASAFMSPGTTPEINIDPKSGAFVVANYQNGKPVGGYAVTRDQLMDIRGRNTDFNAWAQRDQADEHEKARMGLAYAKFNESKRRSNAAAASAAAKAVTQAEKDKWYIRQKSAEAKLAELNLGERIAKSDSSVTRAIAEDYNATDVALDAPEERDVKASQDAVKAGMEKLKDLTQYPTAGSEPVEAGTSGVKDGSGGAPDDGNMGPADQMDTIDNQVANAPGSSGSGKVGKFAQDPLWFDNNPDGTSTPRVGMHSVAAKIMEDAVNPDLNPHGRIIPPEALASLAEGTVGRSQSTAITEDFDDDGTPYATADDGVYKIRLSPEGYRSALLFQEANQGMMAAARGEAPTGEVPGTPAPLPNPAMTPGGGSAMAGPAIPEPAPAPAPAPVPGLMDDTAAPIYH